MENQLEKQLEYEMETWGSWAFLGLQMPQCKYYLQTLGPNVGNTDRHGAGECCNIFSKRAKQDHLGVHLKFWLTPQFWGARLEGATICSVQASCAASCLIGKGMDKKREITRFHEGFQV